MVNIAVIIIIELERYVTNTCIFCIIIGKLSYGKEPSLIILLIINKKTKLGFYHIVLLLGLTVNLKIKDGRESLLDSQEIIER